MVCSIGMGTGMAMGMCDGRHGYCDTELRRAARYGRDAGAAHLEQRLLADAKLDKVLLRQIDARAPSVLADVAQDVRQLQRDAEGEGGLLQWQHRAAASKSNEQA